MIDGWGISCEIALSWWSLDYLMISQHMVRLWLSAVRQQAITWNKVDPDLCRHMASLGHNELSAHCNAKFSLIWPFFDKIGMLRQKSFSTTVIDGTLPIASYLCGCKTSRNMWSCIYMMTSWSMSWKRFPYYLPFVWGIRHPWPGNFPIHRAYYADFTSIITLLSTLIKL